MSGARVGEARARQFAVPAYRGGPGCSDSAARQLTFDTRRGVAGHTWSHDSAYLLFSQDIDGDENHRLFGIHAATGEQRCFSPEAGSRTGIVSVSRRHPTRILVDNNHRDRRNPDLYVLDLVTGEKTLVLENPGFQRFIVDDDYNVRFAVGPTPEGGRQLLQPDAAGKWRSISVIGPDDARTSGWFHLSSDGATLYGVDSRGRDTAALVAVDVVSGRQTVLLESAQADVGGMLTDRATYRPLACWINWQRSRIHVLDESIRADVDLLEASGIGQWSIASRTEDDRIWLVGASTDTRPGVTYLFDRDARTLERLVDHRPELAGLPLARMQSTVISARDGLSLVSYLTLPRAFDTGEPLKSVRPAPLVLMVHGGPWSRDTFGFSSMHQWFADRGYASLSVNFRGSTGFGKAFINAANRQWGRAMSDDLEDAVDWAVEAGLADPKRLAIVGGSYGGYAVLSALTRQPGRYACGVDIFGPANLETLLQAIPPQWEHERQMLYRSVGNPTTAEGREELRANSPVHRAARITDPLMVAQGANDPRVRQSESDAMVEQLVASAIPVTYLLFPDEGHGFGREPNRLVFNAMTEAFLAQHLGGELEPFTVDDFPGNKMRIVHGALPTAR